MLYASSDGLEYRAVVKDVLVVFLVEVAQLTREIASIKLILEVQHPVPSLEYKALRCGSSVRYLSDVTDCLAASSCDNLESVAALDRMVAFPAELVG